jgi:hypothetical protein
MALDRKRTARGALAGGAAAGVWLLSQPLDKRLFEYDHDDARLLGRLAGGSPVLGAALHIQNGLVFGAVYANVVHRLPGPAYARGPLAALVEHVLTWPATAIVEPRLLGSGRAFAQSAWRHLLFGAVLGELERRWNPRESELEPVSDAAVKSNGHGSVEHLVASGPDDR